MACAIPNNEEAIKKRRSEYGNRFPVVSVTDVAEFILGSFIYSYDGEYAAFLRIDEPINDDEEYLLNALRETARKVKQERGLDIYEDN